MFHMSGKAELRGENIPTSLKDHTAKSRLKIIIVGNTVSQILHYRVVTTVINYKSGKYDAKLGLKKAKSGNHTRVKRKNPLVTDINFKSR